MGFYIEEEIVGSTFDGFTADRIRQKYKVDIVRVLKPKAVMTLEFNLERVNIFLDEDGIVTKVERG